ncbi:MAG TPA: hypothetical protein VJ553_05285 [Candidatus Paceibacterota bacterium]|nr:hypothetical protein [Candidatus Paceibacterota bacterium]
MSNELSVMEQKAEQEMSAIMVKASAFVVNNEETYVAADQIITEVRGKVKMLEVELGPPKEAATKAWKAMVALYKKYIDDPLEACKTLDRKRYAWKRAEDNRRAEEAEAIRRAEQKRIADEKLALAARMEEAGMKEQAAAVLDAPLASVVVEIPKVEKPEGQAQIENWQARVVDADAVPRTFCSPDMVKLGRYAKLMKGKASVAGVVFEDVGTVRRRTA